MATSNRRLHPQEGSLTDQLRKAILDSGVTQYRIAKDTGVPQPVLCRFVSGERGITLETAGRLCGYLRLRLARVRR